MRIFERWRPWVTNVANDLDTASEDGWNELIVDTIDAMVAAVKPDGRFVVRQIKQQLRSLRIYTFDPRLSDIAHAAERRSLTVCEICGAQGRLRHVRGVQTLCDEHVRVEVFQARGLR